MSNARKLADNLPTEGSLSGRNAIVNGGMTISQRGTSFSTGSSTIYTLDRFQSATGSSFNFDLTLTQSTDTPTGFSNSLKVSPDSTQTPSGSQNGAIRYNIEAQDLQRFGYGSSDAKKMTLSFYVKSNKTGTYSLQLIGYDGQGSCLTTYTINSANTWERKSITFDPDTSNAFANDNTLGILIAWHLASGPDDVRTASTSWGLDDTGFRIVSGQVNFMDSTSNEWYITGVQLEVGSQATPFEHEPVGVTLSKCLKYFERLEIGDGGMRVAVANNTSSGYGHLTFMGLKRTAPTVTLPTASVSTIANTVSLLTSAGSYRSSVGSIVPNKISKSGCRIACTGFSASNSVGSAVWIYFTTNNGTDPFVLLDAEL